MCEQRACFATAGDQTGSEYEPSARAERPFRASGASSPWYTPGTPCLRPGLVHCVLGQRLVQGDRWRTPMSITGFVSYFRASCVIMFRVPRPRASRGRVFEWHNIRVFAGKDMPARSAWTWHTGDDTCELVHAQMKHVCARHDRVCARRYRATRARPSGHDLDQSALAVVQDVQLARVVACKRRDGHPGTRPKDITKRRRVLEDIVRLAVLQLERPDPP